MKADPCLNIDAGTINPIEHPFFVGSQFHPEFLAHPLAPHPLFSGFIKVAISRKEQSKPLK